jgi:hypothetical protein
VRHSRDSGVCLIDDIRIETAALEIHSVRPTWPIRKTGDRRVEEAFLNVNGLPRHRFGSNGSWRNPSRCSALSRELGNAWREAGELHFIYSRMDGKRKRLRKPLYMQEITVSREHPRNIY